MRKKYSIYLSGLLAMIVLASLILLLTPPSWSSPAALFVTTPAPENLVLSEGANVTLSGGGFSPATTPWLVPERSIRTATTASLEAFGSPQFMIQRDDHLFGSQRSKPE